MVNRVALETFSFPVSVHMARKNKFWISVSFVCVKSQINLPEKCSGDDLHTFSFTNPTFKIPSFSKNVPNICWEQSYEINLPSQAFLDGRSSRWRKLRQVWCLLWCSKVQISNNRQLCINSKLSTVYKSELCYIITLDLS